MPYVDGFIVAVPKKKLAEYKKLSLKAGKVFREYGALDYREWVADDVKVGKWTSFPRAVKRKPGLLTKLLRDGEPSIEVRGAKDSLELGIWKNSAQRTELVKRLLTEGLVRNFETALRGAKNQTRIWLSSADLIEIDGEQCILVISDDITEQRRSEQQLRDVSARLIRAQEEERLVRPVLLGRLLYEHFVEGRGLLVALELIFAHDHVVTW